MRPLGKTMKAAHFNKVSKQDALNSLLATYRATPHPATGEAPGNLLFRNGYKNDFPCTPLTDDQVINARNNDKHQQTIRKEKMNSSNHRSQSKFEPEELVYTRNMVRNKFDPLFGPDIHKIINIEGSGVTMKLVQLVRRHSDDVKRAPDTNENSDTTCWIDTPQDTHKPPPIVPLLPDQPPDSHQNDDIRLTRPRRNIRRPIRYIADTDL